MFTWICPECGAEVPPSENDCPNCRARAKGAAAQPSVAPADEPTSSPVTAPPSPLIAPRPVVHGSPIPAGGNRRPLSPALVAVCSAVAIVALLAILYLYVLPRGGTGQTSAVALEGPNVPGAAARTAHPLAKYIEVTGLRVMEGGAGQARIAFVAVNHSPADLPELDVQVTLTGAGKSLFDFPVTIPSIGPYESKDITAAVKTNLRPYELPDWQTLKPSLRIVAER
jgi:hypothetical protein